MLKAPHCLVIQKVEALNLKLLLFDQFFSIHLVGAKNAKISTKLKYSKNFKYLKKNLKEVRRNFKFRSSNFDTYMVRVNENSAHI